MERLARLRDYVVALGELGELQVVDMEVDWDLELGAIIRRSYELRAPAPLFNAIRGIDGFRVLGAPAGISAQPGLMLARVALSLGLDPRSSGQEIVAAMAEALTRSGIAPRAVTSAACHEHVKQGKMSICFRCRPR